MVMMAAPALHFGALVRTLRRRRPHDVGRRRRVRAGLARRRRRSGQRRCRHSGDDVGPVLRRRIDPVEDGRQVHDRGSEELAVIERVQFVAGPKGLPVHLGTTSGYINPSLEDRG